MDNSSALRLEQKHWDLAYRVALRVLRAPDQAEDVAQEAMILAHLAQDRFAHRSKPESWIYRIAFNAAISHLRKPFRRRYSSEDVERLLENRPEQQATPHDQAVARELAARLDACLADLSDSDQLAFVERFVLGTTERELGTLLDVSTNAAKQRAFRARRTVRHRMNELDAQRVAA